MGGPMMRVDHASDVLGGAEVGEPVPAEHALDGDGEVVAERRDQAQELGGVGGDVALEQDVALGVEDADEHRPRVKVEAAVVLVRLRVESRVASWVRLTS